MKARGSGGELVMRNARRRLLLLLAASLFLPETSQRPAAAQLLGPEFQVNSYTTDGAANSAVAADGAGNFVVVWGGSDQGTWGVFGQRFDSAGSRLGDQFQANTYTTSSQTLPAVAADDSGDFVVTWQSYSQDGSYWGVFGRRFDAEGLPLGDDFQVNTFTIFFQQVPVVAADPAGNFVVVWESWYQDGSLSGVFGQRFDSAGLPAGIEFRVNSYNYGDQRHPTVAMDGAGNFVAAWMGGSDYGDGFGVMGQRFDSAGARLGDEFQVNTYTTNLQRSPAVAADDSGNFIVAWSGAGQGDQFNGVFGQKFDSAGAPLGSEFRVNRYTTGLQARPAVAMDATGNFVVVWGSDGQDGDGYGVFGQPFDSSGLPMGSELRVNSYTTSDQSDPAVAAVGVGNFVVAWTSDGQNGSYTAVIGRQLSMPFFYGGFEAGDACAWSSTVGGGCP